MYLDEIKIYTKLAPYERPSLEEKILSS